MNKNIILGCRVDEDTARVLKEKLKVADKTFSEWIREEIKKENKK